MSQNGRSALSLRAKDAKTADRFVPSAAVRQAPLRGAVPGLGGRQGRLTAPDTFDWQTEIAASRGGAGTDASDANGRYDDAVA